MTRAKLDDAISSVLNNRLHERIALNSDKASPAGQNNYSAWSIKPSVTHLYRVDITLVLAVTYALIPSVVYEQTP